MLKIEQATQVLQNQLMIDAPKDTGNLAFNSIQIVYVSPTHYQILIGGEIAPYAPYTNEPWAKGNNPNEGWINRTIENMKPVLQTILTGSITQEDYEEIIKEQETRLQEKWGG